MVAYRKLKTVVDRVCADSKFEENVISGLRFEINQIIK
jgi:hypothetical protein